MAMKSTMSRRLGLYRPPENFDTNPYDPQKKRRRITEDVGEAQTSPNIDANAYQEMSKRTKRRQGGVLGVYS